MRAVWGLGEARVDEARAALGRRRKPAYTTVQTVMNRLVDRGLLTREREGRGFVYRPAFEEADYVARSIEDRLAGASPAARRIALTNLVDNLEPADLDELAKYANRIRRARDKG